MKKLLLMAAIAVFLMSGCASLQNAGNTSTTVKPIAITGDDGKSKTICCAVTLSDGKERASMVVDVTKTGDDYTFHMDEKGVAAFAGQQISGDALKVAVDGAVKAAVAAALAPVLPALAPVVGAVGASGGLGAATLGAGAVLGVQKLNAPVEPAKQ